MFQKELPQKNPDYITLELTLILAYAQTVAEQVGYYNKLVSFN